MSTSAPPGLTGWVDTHAHVIDPTFDGDRAAVLARAQAAGLAALVLVGYDLRTSRAAIALRSELGLAAGASVGIHPNGAADAPAADFEAIANLAQAEPVVAIGETGLDYYRDRTPTDRQRQAFAWHLRLAEERGLPVIVHNRQADADVAEALEASAARRPAGAVPGVLHCFSSTDPAYLERMLAAGYYVSFAGTVTFNNAADLRAVAASVPLERLLVETDCPYLAPVPHRGRRNEPAFVVETAAVLAALHGQTLDALRLQLGRNSLRVFPALGRVPLGVG